MRYDALRVAECFKTGNITLKPMQYCPPNSIVDSIDIYEQPMYCLIILTFFSSIWRMQRSIMSKPTLMIPKDTE
jgi:hypothetical protein